MKIKNKLLITLSSLTTLSFTTLYLTSCTNEQKLNLPNDYVWANTYENEINNFNYYENNFIDDIQKLANDDSILFYDIGWAATLHKYVPIAHLLRVLEINPNKEIYLYINNFCFDKNKINLKEISEKFPNFKYKFYNGLGINPSKDYKDFNIQITNEILNDIKLNNLEKRNKNLFTSDLTMLLTISYNKTIKNQNINNFVDNILPLLDFKSINLIADGTASTTFFNDDLFYYMANKRIYEYSLSTRSYDNSKRIIEYFMNLNINDKIQFLQRNNHNINPTDILMMFNTSALGDKDNGFCKFNFYFPSLNSIIDVNSRYSSNLSLNYKTKTPLFFNPYLTKNLNFIGLFKTLSRQSISYFYDILKVERPIDLTPIFNNNLNLVIAGNLMESGYIVENEIKKIIAIYKMNETNANNLNLKIKLWYKAHPREQDNYKTIIISKLNEKGYSNIAYSLEFLNKDLPFELLVSNDYFVEDPTNNRYINIYIGFSTISLLLDADRKSYLIKKIIVDDNALKSINERFGSSDQSIIFNTSRIIHVDDLYNSYNYSTSTNTNNSYAIYNNKLKISYKTFNLYNFMWQKWSNKKFNVIFRINNNEYIFENCIADNLKKGGINVNNETVLNKMFFENKNNFKEYNSINWNNDNIAKNLFPYMNNLIDLNSNLNVSPNSFLSCTIKIDFKINNKTTPFIQESSFIIFI